MLEKNHSEVLVLSRYDDDVCQRLRKWFDVQVEEPHIDMAARALCMSRRTLQRELKRLGTSFRKELLRSRKSKFQHALLSNDDKIDSIAASLGFGSGSSFSTTFKRFFGESPKLFRQRARAA